MIQTKIASAKLTKTGIPVRNLWHMLLYVWDVVHLKNHWKSEVESSPTLDALLATILAKLIQQRLRIGLGRDYCLHASEIAGVRGRIDFNESLKCLSFQHSRACCQFQLFSANIPKNQIVRSTMARLVQIGEFGCNVPEADALRARLRRLILDMDSVDIVELKAANIRREQLKRYDADYRLMLAICNLLHRRQMPTEDDGVTGLFQLDRDDFTLYNVYEQFVAKFYAYHLKDWSVTPQQKLAWPTEVIMEYLPAMYPDLTFQHKSSGQLVILDNKFTAKSLVTGRWGKQIFNREHLFQIYAYLRSQEQRSSNHKTSTGVLLYPTVEKELCETLEIQGHAIRFLTIDLSKAWEVVESRLLEIPSF
jgi:5-methylcytosine-specific restriction enzyme subunit McrC